MKNFKIQIGFVLVFALLITVLLTASSLVIIQITTANKNISETDINNQLLEGIATTYATNIAKTLDGTDPSSFMKYVDSNKSNIFFVDTSSGVPPPVKVYQPFATSISNLATKFFETPNTINISPPGTTAANTNTIAIDPTVTATVTITQTSYAPSTTDQKTAIYQVDINSKVCSVSNPSMCQTVILSKKYNRTCPASQINNKIMRALTDRERKRASPNNVDPGGRDGADTVNNTFPNLYCTCADAGYNQTKADGSCSISCAAGFGISGGSCSQCPAGRYSAGGTTNTCQLCPAGTYSATAGSSSCNSCPINQYSSAGATSCSTCSDGKFSAGNASSCLNCNSECTRCSGSASKCSACQPGYGFSSNSCSICLAGTYSTGGTNNCQACPSGQYSSNGASICISCNGNRFWNAGANSCSNCNLGCAICSGSASNCSSCLDGYYLDGTTCPACPSNATCSNNNINCNDGYIKNGNTCIQSCTGGSSSGGTGQSTGTGNCKCPDASYYWNGSNCLSCSTAITNCTECSSATNCTLCNSGYAPSAGGNQCNQVCPNGCPFGRMRAVPGGPCTYFCQPHCRCCRNCGPGDYITFCTKNFISPICEECEPGHTSNPERSICR